MQNGFAYVSNTNFDDNGHGVEVHGASTVAAITDSTANLNFGGFFANFGGTNGTAYQIGGGTTIAGSNPGTSVIGPGQTLTATAVDGSGAALTSPSPQALVSNGYLAIKTSPRRPHYGYRGRCEWHTSPFKTTD